jgi:hypothetical protein
MKIIPAPPSHSCLSLESQRLQNELFRSTYAPLAGFPRLMPPEPATAPVWLVILSGLVAAVLVALLVMARCTIRAQHTLLIEADKAMRFEVDDSNTVVVPLDVASVHVHDYLASY